MVTTPELINDFELSYDSYTKIWIATLFFAAISFFLNILTIVVIVSSDLCCKFSYVLLVNLSIADALTSVSTSTNIVIRFLPVSYVGNLQLFYVFTSTFCLFNISSVPSLLTIVLITFELFFMVKYPLQHIRLFKQMRVRSIRCIIIFVWVISTLPSCIHTTYV